VDKFRTAEFVLVFVGAILGGFIWLNENHANEQRTAERIAQQEQVMLEKARGFDIKLQEAELGDLDEQIDEDNKIRHHYEELAKEAPLSGAQERRLRYITDSLDKKYEKKRRMEKNIDALKGEN
jgi:hypothetical protein